VSVTALRREALASASRSSGGDHADEPVGIADGAVRFTELFDPQCARFLQQ
jgi:hypothetical protein